MDNNLIKITGLWKSKDKNGNTLLSGGLNPMTQLMVMANTYKKTSREPDFHLYIKPNKKREDETPQAPQIDDFDI